MIFGSWRGVIASLTLWSLSLPMRAAVPPNQESVTLPNSIVEVSSAPATPVAGAAPALAASSSRPVITRRTLSQNELNETMEIGVALKMRNFAELQARVAHGEIISREEMAARYWPLVEDYNAVANWLASEGLTIADEDASHLIVRAHGTVDRVSQTFQATFARVAADGKEYSSAITEPTLPAGLVPALVGVNGLQPHLHKHVHIMTQPANVGGSFSPPYLPSQIIQAYNGESVTATGAGQTIAIVMSFFPSKSDLTQFWATCGVSQSLSNIAFVPVGAGPPSSATDDSPKEASLDVEWSSSIAPGAQIRLYGTPDLSDTNLDAAYQQIYNDVTSQPTMHQMSLSYGGSELDSSQSELTTDAQLFAQLASAGITVFAASGDAGSEPDSSPSNPNQNFSVAVESPASDPSVTGVGGTSLTLNLNTGAVSTETAWTGSGGGTSAEFPLPVWQVGTGVLGAYGNRLVPDVSASADPNHGVYLIWNGSEVTGGVGGTSWSSPTWAGFCALINQMRAQYGEPSLGLLGPKIYPLMLSSSFRDITSGSNGDYNAGIGYDPVTGLGVPNLSTLVQQLSTILSQPVNQEILTGQNAQFTVGAGGPSPVYQWQRMASGSSTWSNLSDTGAYSGSQTATLTVTAATGAMSGDQFQCIVTTTDGFVATSAPANLIVIYSPWVTTTLAGLALNPGITDDTFANARFNLPNSTTVDRSNGDIYVADTNNNTVRKMSATTGLVSTLAGHPGSPGTANGTGTQAQFNFDNGIAMDLNGNIYVADSNNDEIRHVTLSGVVTTFAGTAGSVGSNSSQFDFPAGVAVDQAGNIYVADSYNNLIRKITPQRVVSTLAGHASRGNPAVAGYADGAATTTAEFYFPQAVVVDSAGDVYVADGNNNTIRKITTVNGVATVSTFAGQAPYAGVADGPGAFARFNNPGGLALDSAGNLYVADTNNHSIRKITPAGLVSTLTGDILTTGTADGLAGAAQFDLPFGVSVDNAGNLIIADTFNDTIRKAVLAAAPQIQTQPVNETVYASQSAAFTVAATGNPSPTFQWQVSTDGGMTWTDLSDNATYSGSATATLNVTATTVGMSGDQYQCLVSNAVGEVTSTPAVLTVDAPVIPSFSAQPQNMTVTVGQTVIFSVTASGEPTPTFQWQVSIDGGMTWMNLSDNATYSGAATSTLTITDPTGTLNGNLYQAIINNIGGNITSTPATLTIDTAPSITTQPQNQTVTAGQPAAFGIAAAGNPAPGYQWQVSMDGGTTWSNLGNTGPYSGTESATLNIASTTLAMNGYQFQCIASNTVNNATSNAATLTVNPPPVAPSIGTQPDDVTVNAGQVATFVVTASGLPAPNYQWQVSNNRGFTWSNLSDTGSYSGSMTSTLTIANTSAGLNGNWYLCLVSNVAGSVPTSIVTLTVNVPPSISTQPQNVTVTAGQSASFGVSVSGQPAPNYQWQVSTDGGLTWTNLSDTSPYSGSATATLTITGATGSLNGNQYQCLISNIAGSVSSSAATLAVNVPPFIVTQPQNQTAAAGQSATFSVSAGGQPAPNYQWQVSTNNGATWSNLNNNSTYGGATTASLTITGAVGALNGNQYRGLASNGIGIVASNGATLTVNAPPSIGTQPQNKTVTAGQPATFSVSASGPPAPNYQWEVSTDGGMTWTNLSDDGTYSGSMTATLTITGTTATLNGNQYLCFVSNAFGNLSSNAATLTVNAPPSITLQPQNVTVTAGQPATFSISASGLPSPHYQWQVSTNGGGTWANLNNNGAYSGTTTATLTIISVTGALNANEYQCLVSNVTGSVTSNAAVLTVNVPPSFTAQAQNETVTAGQPATFSVTASGQPAPTYQWQFSTNGGATWTNLSDNGTYSGSMTATLTITSTTGALNGYQYQCLVTNIAGNASSNAATLTVNVPPSVTTQPQNQTVTVGQPATFSVSASGQPAPGYQWQVSVNNGTTWMNLSDTGPYSGSATATLALGSTTLALSGNQYQCLVSNVVSTITSNAATLTVNPVPAAPAITAPPQNSAVSSGGTATFTVAVSGFPAATVQWQVSTDGGVTWNNLSNGASFSGATSATLNVNGPTFALNGEQFRAFITNGVNPSITSSPVTLTVYPVGYLAWANSLGLSSDVLAPDAEPFNDGLSNLLRFALNLAGTPTPGQLPAASATTIAGVPNLVLQYRQNMALSDIQLVVQSSSDLINWVALPSANITQLPTADADTFLFQALIAVPANGTGVFLRVEVEPSP